MPEETTKEVIMTVYEKWALVLSVVAILIPIIQWAWKKWIVQPKLNHYHTGYAYLFINQSGSYIKVESVYEALNKPISIKHISAKVEREHDHCQRNYVWSAFTSPTNLQFVGNSAFSNEIAHPFRIEADHIYCAFTEFADKDNSAYRSFSNFVDKLTNEAKHIGSPQVSYNDAFKQYATTEAYKEAKTELMNELFWKIGTYILSITAEYGKTKKTFSFVFEVSQEQTKQLQHNIDETLAAPLKRLYGVPFNMQAVQAKLDSKDGES